jgi:hypothetical protein
MRGLAAGGTGKLKGTRAEQAEKAPASESGHHKIKGASKSLGALTYCSEAKELLRRGNQLIGEDSSETPGFLLIVQHHNGNDAQIFFAGVALRDFALQVLQKTVGEAIESALAAGIFLVALAAVGTDELNFVLLRIAVQGSPSGAAHPDGFGIMPFHRTP